MSCRQAGCTGEAELSVIVEAMGRVNSDVYLGDRKGLVGPVVLQNGTKRTPLEKWRIHTAPLQNDQAPAVSDSPR